jgi:hypothetical protein
MPCNAVSVDGHAIRCCLSACPGDTLASRRHFTVPSVTADILPCTSYLPAKHRLPETKRCSTKMRVLVNEGEEERVNEAQQEPVLNKSRD